MRQVGPWWVWTVQRQRPGTVEGYQDPEYGVARLAGENGHTGDDEGQAGDRVDRLSEKPCAELLAVEIGPSHSGVSEGGMLGEAGLVHVTPYRPADHPLRPRNLGLWWSYKRLRLQ